jgi:hypothetical protein
MAELTLFVYMIGLGHSFPVDIQRSKTVGHLRKAILLENPNDLKGVDARRLVLYKVEIPDGGDLEQVVLQAARQELGVPSSKLSEIFPEQPREKEISILVEVPDTSE